MRFEERRRADDGYGNKRGEVWVPKLEVWSGRMLLKGGETVIASRLAGRGAAILKVRSSAATREIRADWRAVDTRDGTVWHVKEPPRLTDDRAFLEMLVESGVPN